MPCHRQSKCVIDNEWQCQGEDTCLSKRWWVFLRVCLHLLQETGMTWKAHATDGAVCWGKETFELHLSWLSGPKSQVIYLKCPFTVPVIDQANAASKIQWWMQHVWSNLYTCIVIGLIETCKYPKHHSFWGLSLQMIAKKKSIRLLAWQYAVHSFLHKSIP